MTPRWFVPERAAWLMLWMGMACALLLGRVVHIQWYARQYYVDNAAAQPGKTRELRGQRGRILDRRYRVLAESVAATTVSASPEAIQRWATKDAPRKTGTPSPNTLRENAHIQCAARAISATLDLPYNEVLHKLCRDSRYVVLGRRVDADRAEKLKRLEIQEPDDGSQGDKPRPYKIPSLVFETEERREYTFGPLGSAVLGYCNAEQTPMGGVEWWYRQITEGDRSAVGQRYDAWDRRIPRRRMGGRLRPAPGKDLVLTLDLGTQQIVEKALDDCVAVRDPSGINAVVMSAHDGSIVALACRPNFDPNDISKARFAKAPVSMEQLTNRAASKAMDPGSTFKLLTIAAALDCGAITEKTAFYCKGTENVGGYPLRCWGRWAKHGHGYLTPPEILANSCNLCAAHVALRLGAKRFCEFLRRCGIGERPRAGFPAEAAGTLLEPERMATRDVACLGFGQGVQVSDVQLAAAMCAIFNGGILYQPHIVSGYVDPAVDVEYEMEPRPVRRVCSETTSATMRRLARHVVDSGTGARARIPGVAVGGKTATAQIFDDRQQRWLDGPRDYVMSFVLTAPMDRRADFVVIVSVERPKVGDHGADVAAPMAKQIAEYLLAQPSLFPKWTDESRDRQLVAGQEAA